MQNLIRYIKKTIRLVPMILPAMAAFSAADPIPEGISMSPESDGYRVDFTLPQYRLDTTESNGEQFLLLSVESFGVSGQIGAPQLPSVSFNLMIPDESSIPEITITDKTVKEEELPKRLYPVQIPWPKNKPLSERPFSINESYYAVEGIKEQPFYTLSEPFVIAGVTGITVTLFPFRYDAAVNKLMAVADMTLKIKVPGSLSTKSIRTSSAFAPVFKETFVNAAEISTLGSLAGENYLFITAPEFTGSISRLVEYRRRGGYVVDVFTTDQTGRTETEIKSFIQNRYDDPQTRPSFILLVGDVGYVPHWLGEDSWVDETDLYYVTLEGDDYFPDAYIGRFPATSEQEVQNMVRKTILTDSLNDNIDKNVLFMASEEEYRVPEGSHNYVDSAFFQPFGYTSTKRYCHTYSATTDQVITDLNSGQKVLVFAGNANAYVWKDGPRIEQEDVRSLSNTTYPFVYSFTCLTGAYSFDECFGETWLRVPNGGAIFMGAGSLTLWSEDDFFERDFFETLFADSIPRNGPAVNVAKMKFYNRFSPDYPLTLRYFEQYNLLGDPALGVYATWFDETQITYHSGEFSDQSGDGYISPDETVNIRVTLQNNGVMDAYNVSATLSSTDANVRVTDNNAYFGTIHNRGGTTQAQDDFTIHVDADCPTPYLLPLRLNITDTNGKSWTTQFTVEVFTTNTVDGYVLARSDSSALSNATITFSGPISGTTTTDHNGYYSFNTIDGTYTLSASAENYPQSEEVQVTVPPDVSNFNFYLTRPTISVSPSSITESLDAGNTITRELTVNNQGYESLDFSLYISEDLRRVTSAESLYDSGHFEALHKDSADRRIGLPAPNGRGGPDAFGYRWIDSDDPSGPEYVWNDIRSSGEVLSLSDDDNERKDLSFSFPFYENRYSSIYIGSNGFVSLGGGSDVYHNSAIPFSGNPNNIIAGFWDDLRPDSNVYFQDFGSRAVVQYHNVKQYNTDDVYTFQIVIEEYGDIYFYYQSMTTNLGNATIGIENQTGEDGLCIVYNSAYVHSEMAVHITTNEWISANPTFGVIPPRSSVIVDVTLDARDLRSGNYSASINLMHNDPVAPNPFSVPINMSVTGNGEIVMQPILTGVSAIPATRAGGYIIENVIAGSAAGGMAQGERYHLFLR